MESDLNAHDVKDRCSSAVYLLVYIMEQDWKLNASSHPRLWTVACLKVPHLSQYCTQTPGCKAPVAKDCTPATDSWLPSSTTMLFCPSVPDGDVLLMEEGGNPWSGVLDGFARRASSVVQVPISCWWPAQ